jgi:hypothetical protein
VICVRYLIDFTSSCHCHFFVLRSINVGIEPGAWRGKCFVSSKGARHDRMASVLDRQLNILWDGGCDRRLVLGSRTFCH